MRKILYQKSWSHGTPLGYPGAIWPLKVVLGNFFLVILNTYGMVYITVQVTALDYFCSHKSASLPMCQTRVVYFGRESSDYIYVTQPNGIRIQQPRSTKGNITFGAFE